MDIMEYRFKTKTSHEDSIDQLTAFLKANNKIKNWRVDVNGEFRFLTVETDELTPDMMQMIVNNAGFTRETVSQ
jgi:hypothetical protein